MRCFMASLLVLNAKLSKRRRLPAKTRVCHQGSGQNARDLEISPRPGQIILRTKGYAVLEILVS